MAKIFVIEDDESIRELVKVALQGYGHEVFDFECAEDALEELKHTKADLGIFEKLMDIWLLLCLLQRIAKLKKL